MFSQIVLVGNVTRDIDLRYLPNGIPVAVIGVATNYKYKNAQGENVEEPCFIDVKIFGKSAEIANQYLKKGSRALFEGRLAQESWTTERGEKKSRHLIRANSLKLMDYKEQDKKQGGGNAGGYQGDYQHRQDYQGDVEVVYQDAQGNERARERRAGRYDIPEDEIPF